MGSKGGSRVAFSRLLANASHHARVAADDARASLLENEQSAGDADQTSADADQTGADRDQSSADSDQQAADRDQAASDRDLASGGDLATHEATKNVREHTAEQRDQSTQARLDSAAHRDAIARQRDLAALARDRAADAHDEAMQQADADVRRTDRERGDDAGEFVLMAAARRRRAAQLRAKAAIARALAAHDRRAASEDRERAASERLRAHEDRQRLLAQLAAAETDELTGARVRAAGLDDLRHELDRCDRTGRALVVAYIDVVGLKAINDTEGHAAGDELLKRVVGVIQNHLRSYDLVVRLGGDEFLCVMSDVTMRDARKRLEVIAAALARARGTRAIRTGLAEAHRDEGVARLISRADAEMLLDTRSDRTDLRPSALRARR